MLLNSVKENKTIAITGIGVVLPNTSSLSDFWSYIRDGQSQVGYLSRFNVDSFPVKLAAELDGFDHRKFLPNLPERFAAKYSRDILVVMSALEEARIDARLGREDVDPTRTGFITSSSRGPLEWWCGRLQNEDPADGVFGAHDMLPGLAGTPASMAAIYSNIKGLVMTLSSACVGGYLALNTALRELEQDTADVMFVGGYEFPLFRPMLEIYNANRLLTKEQDDPAGAIKPYDRRRDGFALGEGAIVLSLERLDRAIARGARVYSTILGLGTMNESNHPTTMDLSGELTASFIHEVLRGVGRSVEDVDYFCGHGTATRYNDMAEGRAISAAYGGKSRRRWAPMSSIKPIFGHTMGASGVVNIAASALMIYHQCLCPTINLDEPDPDCDWDHVAEGARSAKLETVLSMSFAIGSQTSVVAMSGLS